MPDFRELSALVRSRMPLVCIETVEEPKVLRLLERLSREDNLDLHVWSVADGLAQTNFRYGPSTRVNSLFGTVEATPTATERTDGHRRPVPDTRALEAALHYIDNRITSYNVCYTKLLRFSALKLTLNEHLIFWISWPSGFKWKEFW